jgi:hypothetical protein
MSNALRAAATALSTSAGEASGKVIKTFSVTGEITSSLPLAAGFSHLPPMKKQSGDLTDSSAAVCGTALMMRPLLIRSRAVKATALRPSLPHRAPGALSRSGLPK